ncbi:hypothetical protein RV02_GL003584 [Enterococcus gilvus]|nr:hypothetical protein RV02_GL003584 [Enterococcus gilvus]
MYLQNNQHLIVIFLKNVFTKSQLSDNMFLERGDDYGRK